MNLKVRLKNKAFWVGFIPALVGFVYATLALIGKAPSISEAFVVKILQEIISILAMLGVFTDPTTEGFADSERAMTYEVPYAREKSFSLFSIFKRKGGDE